MSERQHAPTRLNNRLRRLIKSIVFSPDKSGAVTVATAFADGLVPPRNSCGAPEGVPLAPNAAVACAARRGGLP